jgi:hypothetical protein
MVPLGKDEIVYLLGNTGTIAIVKVADASPFFIDTEEKEIALFLEPEDLLVASGFDVGAHMERGLRCVLYNIREIGSPLIVLPRNHPGSKRLKFVLSAGSVTTVNCNITPGTHPEQDVVCGVEEFAGLCIKGVKGGVELNRSLPIKRDAF